jgi:hypothetical protein
MSDKDRTQECGYNKGIADADPRVVALLWFIRYPPVMPDHIGAGPDLRADGNAALSSHAIRSNHRTRLSARGTLGMPCLSHWTAASVGSISFHRSSANNAPARCSRSARSTLGHCWCRRSAHRWVQSSAFMIGSVERVHGPIIVAIYWMDVQYRHAPGQPALQMPPVRRCKLPQADPSRAGRLHAVQRSLQVQRLFRHLLGPCGLARGPRETGGAGGGSRSSRTDPDELGRGSRSRHDGDLGTRDVPRRRAGAVRLRRTGFQGDQGSSRTRVPIEGAAAVSRLADPPQEGTRRGDGVASSMWPRSTSDHMRPCRAPAPNLASMLCDHSTHQWLGRFALQLMQLRQNMSLPQAVTRAVAAHAHASDLSPEEAARLDAEVTSWNLPTVPRANGRASRVEVRHAAD